MTLNTTTLPSRRGWRLVLPLALSLATATAVQAQMAHPMAPAASGPMGAMPHAAHAPGAMKQSMLDGMAAMKNMSMSGDIDKDFAMMMKIHHQGALDMAHAEIAHGKSPVMKAMAKRIVAAQKKEIAQFDQWLARQP